MGYNGRQTDNKPRLHGVDSLMRRQSTRPKIKTLRMSDGDEHYWKKQNRKGGRRGWWASLEEVRQGRLG